MKAACVLVCLALAQGISANIFKKIHRPVEDLIVQPLDYIHQYAKSWYQPQEPTYQTYVKQKQQKQQQKKQHYSSSSSQEKLSENSQQNYDDWSQQPYVNLRSSSSNQKWNKPLFTAIMKVQNEVVEPSGYEPKIIWPVKLNKQQQQQQPQQQEEDQQQQQKQQQQQQQQLTAAEQEEIQKIFVDAQQAVKKLTPEEKSLNQQTIAAVMTAHNEDDHLNATELLKKNNYPVEEHIVKTDDGYYLTLIRIPPKKQTRDVTKKPVVFLMHGLLGSADDWLLMGPGKSMPYLLSDAGYDVWMGNARGNKYSREHVSKHPAVYDFWQFSGDEVALHDLPAMLDYTLKTSGQQKLFYVGYSLGSTAVFALTAAKPEYNDKINKIYALAPMVYMQHIRSPLIRLTAPDSPFQQSLYHELGNGEFKPSQKLLNIAGGQMLQNAIGSEKMSTNAYTVLSGANGQSPSAELIPVIMGHLPAGTSTKVIKQIGQQKVSGDFTMYNYGDVMNEKVYGSTQPPKYQLENVQVPVSMYYAQRDWLSVPADVERLQQTLPTAEPAIKVPEPYFSHMDFQFSTKAPELIYKPLIENMNNF